MLTIFAVAAIASLSAGQSKVSADAMANHRLPIFRYHSIRLQKQSASSANLGSRAHFVLESAAEVFIDNFL